MNHKLASREQRFSQGEATIRGLKAQLILEQQASTDKLDSRDRRIGQKETTIQDLTAANAELRKTQETFIRSLSQRETRIQDLREDLASSCDAQDVREFKGIQEGKIVLVRAQRCCSERRGLVIVEQSDHTRIRWRGES